MMNKLHGLVRVTDGNREFYIDMDRRTISIKKPIDREIDMDMTWKTGEAFDNYLAGLWAGFQKAKKDHQ